MNPETIVEALKLGGVLFELGLTNEEFDRIESTHGFHFPPDLRALLATALPVGEDWTPKSRWVNWRAMSDMEIETKMSEPVEGLLWQIRHDDWIEAWGPKPAVVEECDAIAQKELARVPRMIPIYGHRFMPAAPSEPGNPVFSAVGSDIIYFGSDLENYLHNEFPRSFGRPPFTLRESIRRIAFWTQMVERGELPAS